MINCSAGEFSNSVGRGVVAVGVGGSLSSSFSSISCGGVSTSSGERDEACTCDNSEDEGIEIQEQ